METINASQLRWRWVCAGECDATCYWTPENCADGGSPVCECDRDMIPVPKMTLDEILGRVPSDWVETGEAMIVAPGDRDHIPVYDPRPTTEGKTYDTPFGPRAIDGYGFRYIVTDGNDPIFTIYDPALDPSIGTCPQCGKTGAVGDACCQGFWTVNDADTDTESP